MGLLLRIACHMALPAPEVPGHRWQQTVSSSFSVLISLHCLQHVFATSLCEDGRHQRLHLHCHLYSRVTTSIRRSLGVLAAPIAHSDFCNNFGEAHRWHRSPHDHLNICPLVGTIMFFVINSPKSTALHGLLYAPSSCILEGTRKPAAGSIRQTQPCATTHCQIAIIVFDLLRSHCFTKRFVTHMLYSIQEGILPGEAMELYGDEPAQVFDCSSF